MSIWTYAQQTREIEIMKHNGNECFFCHATMIELLYIGETFVNNGFSSTRIFGCPNCGWWDAYELVERRMYRGHGYTVRNNLKCAAGSLLKLDISDKTAPIQAIRDHLMIHRKALVNVHPDRLEKVVADVYKDLGYHSIATASSGDDGIDVILDKGGIRIGVQVKRYKNKVQIKELRELAGALVFDGMTKGVFVTTSDFTTGAPRTVQGFQRRGIQIELINGGQFLTQLEIAQRAMYKNREEFDEAAILNHLVEIRSSTTWEDSFRERDV
jgi:HJR/Mrr/RecB family endonuclease